MARQMMKSCTVAMFTGLCAVSAWAFDYEQVLVVGKYRGSATLSGFPVLVRVSPETIPDFAYSQCRVAAGGDLRFETIGGVVCPHEIEMWNTAGESLVWVRIPELSGTNTRFRMLWGDASAVSPVSSRDVWKDSAGGSYAGVWHFGEEITSEAAAETGSADSACQSPSVDMTARPVQYGQVVFTSEMVSTNGVVGLARVNQTRTTGYHSQQGGNSLHVGNYDALSVGDTFTISGWFREYERLGWPGLVNRETGWSGNGWAVFGVDVYDYIACRKSTSGGYSSWAVGNMQNGWLHVVAVYDGPKLTLYINGEEWIREDLPEAFGDNGNDLRFGLWYSALAGAYDEIRLHSDPVSKDWAVAEYDSVKVVDFVSAVKTPTRYVSPTVGSDVDGDGSKANPWATIEHACLHSDAGDEIRVAGGAYVAGVLLRASDGVKTGLTVRGGYDDDWRRDRKSYPTVIRPSDSTQPCISIDGDIRLTLVGFTLTGGSYGLKTSNGCNWIHAEGLVVTNNASGGLLLSGSDQAGVTDFIATSLIADNGGCGIDEATEYTYAEAGVRLELVNCTLVGNASYAIDTESARIVLRNTVIGEHGARRSVRFVYGPMETYSSIVWNGEKAVFDYIFDPGYDYDTYGRDVPLRTCAGTMRTDPLLTDGYSLSAASLGVGRGIALSRKDLVEVCDVQGVDWQGVYDIGCFKSSSPKVFPDMLQNVYVSSDGDDGNDGSSAHPLRTPARAAARVAPNGVIHVGEGAFIGTVVLDKQNVTLSGSGESTVILSPDPFESAVSVVATGVTVTNLTVANGYVGVQISGNGSGVRISDCVIRDNTRGISSSKTMSDASSGTFTVSYCIISNNAMYGLQDYHNAMIGYNLLVVRNGRSDHSAGVASGSPSQARPIWLYNCTIADNVGQGIFSGRSSDAELTHDRNFVNCIVSGNSLYGYYSQQASGLYGNFRNCVVSENGTDYGRTPESKVNCLDEPVRFRRSGHLFYDLSTRSPARGRGVTVTELEGARASFSDDLQHAARTRPWNIGCYGTASPGFAITIQ